MTGARKLFLAVGISIAFLPIALLAAATGPDNWQECTTKTTTNSTPAAGWVARSSDPRAAGNTAMTSSVVEVTCKPANVLTGYPLALLAIGVAIAVLAILPLLRRRLKELAEKGLAGYRIEKLEASIGALGQTLKAEIARDVSADLRRAKLSDAVTSELSQELDAYDQTVEASLPNGDHGRAEED